MTLASLRAGTTTVIQGRSAPGSTEGVLAWASAWAARITCQPRHARYATYTIERAIAACSSLAAVSNEIASHAIKADARRTPMEVSLLAMLRRVPVQAGGSVAAPRCDPKAKGDEPQDGHHQRDTGALEEQVEQIRGRRRHDDRQEGGDRQQGVQDPEDASPNL